MGKMEDFEYSLQVLRGFQTDITAEVNEIKVINSGNSSLVVIEIEICIFFSRTRRRVGYHYIKKKRRGAYKHMHTTHSEHTQSNILVLGRQNHPYAEYIKLDHDLNSTTPGARDMK